MHEVSLTFALKARRRALSPSRTAPANADWQYPLHLESPAGKDLLVLFTG